MKALPLADYIAGHIREEDLARDVYQFQQSSLPGVDYDRLLRAARVAKNPKTYQDLSRGHIKWNQYANLVYLSDEETQALRDEQDSIWPDRGMFAVITTVALAAFLQGYVQSSINGSSLYRDDLGLGSDNVTSSTVILQPHDSNDWAFGATNAAALLGAVFLGCWLTLPISDRFGRKGSMVVAATIVLITSILMAIIPVISMTIPKWKAMIVLRSINGIGMGIKAVNTPIFATETTIGYWRGTSILTWQLWVAFGMMVGFITNLLFATADNHQFTLALILGAPILPAGLLLLVLCVCPESPRYYLRKGPSYNPGKAYAILRILRKVELIAMRDIYLLHKSVQHEHMCSSSIEEFDRSMHLAKFANVRDFAVQFLELLQCRRLRNALLSSSIVALAQQLCGINILAFYSGTFFFNLSGDIKTAMYFSLGFGAVNFFFALPAIGTIDTLGRRKWLIVTLPLMALCMAGSAFSFLKLEAVSTSAALVPVAVFLFVHAALYSPGLGPIPSILAAESFPLSHREVGCASAISINFLFAGLLSIFFPSINSTLGSPGCFDVFAGLNLLAFILVFLFVEETKSVSLEDLDFIFAVPKKEFSRFQLFTYLPWLLRQYIPWLFCRYILCQRNETGWIKDAEGLNVRKPNIPPSLYIRKIYETQNGPDVENQRGEIDEDTA